MLRSSLASLIVDVTSRRTLPPLASFSHPAHISRSSRRVLPSLYSSHTPLRFRIQTCNHRHLSSYSSPSEKHGPSSSTRSSFAGRDDAFTAAQNSSNGHNSSPPQPSSKVLTIPTILTIARVAAVPLLVATFYADSSWGTTATTSIFIAAAITDWLDGYLARKMKLGSAFGAFLDPVADKLMVAATLILLCTKPMDVGVLGPLPWLLTVPSIAIIGREITMSAVREWAASQNGKLLEAVAVNNLGKWKTATQMTALTILLASRDSNVGWLVASGAGLLYVSAGLSVWSLVVYMRKIWKVLLK
ncbi:CDP-diacylglycerol--glycerol-3-phosphate 3-phosphatidyltransferase 1, chloroplastic [Brassica rapa]|uniref:CDP-diacylglycerol--glycerol-3-phosphate 3-phosphatidyltransferase 1, chloroplastic n=1 Tax=Brassica campestris TaxID=3711 RepID=UPI0006AAA54E|nr:CDP-diacylglycerol--glycerol-3-phosphate 3-phosphatidyltransferase 1, chloroplastic [Brassica rapa]